MLFALLACAPDVATEPVGTPTPTDAPEVPTPTDSPTPTDPIPTPTDAQSDGFSYLPPDYDVVDPTFVVYLGDSITRGEGAGSDRGYVDLLHADDGSVYEAYAHDDLVGWFPGIEHAVNVAVSGGTSATLVNSELTALYGWMDDNLDGPPAGPTVFVITVGGNDLQAALLPGSDVPRITSQTLENIAEAVDALRDPTRFPNGSRIFVTNVYEPSDGTGQSSCFLGFGYADKLAPLQAYNEDLHDLGESMGFAVVDLRGHFLGHGANHANADLPAYDADDPTRWFAPDCIHPNNRGHHEVRRLFLGAIAGELGPFTP